MNILAIISMKNNILESEKIVEALTPMLKSSIPSSIKAQGIYLLSVQSKKNQEIFLPILKIINQ